MSNYESPPSIRQQNEKTSSPTTLYCDTHRNGNAIRELTRCTLMEL